MRTTSKLVALTMCAVLVTACGSDSTARQRQRDTRSLSARLEAKSASVALSEPAYRSAAEAAPLTRFVIDGKPAVAVSSVFAVGTVDSVVAGVGLDYDGYTPSTADSGQQTAPEVEFGSDASDLDVVVVSLDARTGVRSDGSDVSGPVSFLLAVPAPTDLESLREQLIGVDVGVLLNESESGLSLGPDVLEVVGFDTFLGKVAGESVEFGTLTTSPLNLQPETVLIGDLLQGAGTIEVRYENGGFVRT